MSEQKITGWVIVAAVLAVFYWLMKNLNLLHGTSAAAGADVAQAGIGDVTSVQAGIVGGPQNAPTVTSWPCSDCASGSGTLGGGGGGGF